MALAHLIACRISLLLWLLPSRSFFTPVMQRNVPHGEMSLSWQLFNGAMAGLVAQTREC